MQANVNKLAYLYFVRIVNTKSNPSMHCRNADDTIFASCIKTNEKFTMNITD